MRDSAVATGWVHALVSLAQASRDLSVEDTLQAVADTVCSVLGYTCVAVNAYRPARHDYEVVLVQGDPGARDALLHTVQSWSVFHEQLLRPGLERVPGAYFLTAGDTAWDTLPDTWTPAARPGPVGPDAWLPTDGVLVELRSTDGRPLGVLSVDEPESGLRPTDAELEMLVAVSAHAAFALDTAQRRGEYTRHRSALTALAGLPARLLAHTLDADVLAEVCAVAGDALGYRSVAAFVCPRSVDGPPGAQGHVCDVEVLDPVAGIGRAAAPVSAPAIRELLARGPSSDEFGTGCRLAPRSVVLGGVEQPLPPGAGPRVWHDRVLLAPLQGEGGLLVGLLVLDDPVDGLLPGPDGFGEARLLADQAVTALTVARQRAELDHQAHHDALTGLRNRRDLEQLLDGLPLHAPGAAVLLCDLDHFKSVNDRLGHAAGDRVLEAFAGLLHEHARGTDLAVRLGGEEFCLLLPATGVAGACAVAQRLLDATPSHLAGIVTRQTVAVGVATTEVSGAGAGLLRAADAALYAAKQNGRNRCYAATPTGPELVALGRTAVPAPVTRRHLPTS